jgi:hypothetical protein
VRPDSEPVIDRDERPNLPGREPPNRPMLVLAALGTVALGAGAVMVFSKGKNSVMKPDAQPKLDAPFYAFEPDAPPDGEPIYSDGPIFSSTDAPIDAPIDAPPDAHVERDAGVKVKADAAVPPPDAAVVVAGKATLKIGANPWGDIKIDGVASGRTPKTIEVTAGKHLVEVTFSGDDPPVKKSFPIDVTPGQNLPIQADFTK